MRDAFPDTPPWLAWLIIVGFAASGGVGGFLDFGIAFLLGIPFGITGVVVVRLVDRRYRRRREEGLTDADRA